MHRRLAAAVLTVLIGTAAADTPAWDPVERYTVERVEGWRVLVHKDLDAPGRRDLRDRTLRLLSDHLYRVSRVLPAPALAKVRKSRSGSKSPTRGTLACVSTRRPSGCGPTA